MSVAPISSSSGLPGLNQAEALTPGERAKASQLKGSALRNATPAAQRAAVAAQFEAVLVRQLLGNTMTKMLGGAEGGAASGVYGDMLSETMASQLTAGQGLGLGRVIEQQLTPRGAAWIDTSSNPPAASVPTGESRATGPTT